MKDTEHPAVARVEGEQEVNDRFYTLNMYIHRDKDMAQLQSRGQRQPYPKVKFRPLPKIAVMDG